MRGLVCVLSLSCASTGEQRGWVSAVPTDTSGASGFDTGAADGWRDDTGDTSGSGDEADTRDAGGQCVDDGSFPIPHWRTDLPENHGMDPRLLADAAAYASVHESNCLLVARHGAIVGEWYWQGTGPTTKVKNWSVAKAVSAAVVGVALDRGEIDSVDQAAAEFIPEWQGTARESITLHDLMSMSSGLRFDMLADNVTMPLARNMTALALEAPLDNPPGALWEYNNHSVQAIEPILRSATGMAPDDYADAYLFHPIGASVDWKRDETGHPAMYMNARASCRDNARLAYLYLRRGCWGGERVLSEEWVERSTSPSTSMNRGYGYWWWLNGEEPTLDSVTFEDKGHMLHPFAPEDSFCAVGLGSQFVEIVPSLDLVVVRLGTAPHDDLAAWFDPLALFDELSTDGEQVVHNNIMELVLGAVIE